MPEKTARYMLLAGQKAARVLVFDEAARRFEQGLSELEQLARTPEIRRMEYDLTLAAA
jgi:hypothetical protein